MATILQLCFPPSMPKPEPRFSVGDLVRERFPFATAKREIGTVIERYEFEDKYRYVVQFEDGNEEVFFERELLPVSREQH